MNDDFILRHGGRVDADVDVPEARPGAPHHNEWVIDEAVEETFPASDAPTPPQPGSLAGLRYARAGSGGPPTPARMLLYAAAAAVIALIVWRRRVPR
jgi:hypothetical protein